MSSVIIALTGPSGAWPACPCPSLSLQRRMLGSRCGVAAEVRGLVFTWHARHMGFQAVRVVTVADKRIR
jgi:hypothetical protein